VLLALLALLVAQGFGLAHRALHDPSHRAAVGTAHSDGHDDCQHDAAHAVGVPEFHPAAGHAAAGGQDFALLEGLFQGHDEGSAECRLLDQLTHADALLGGAFTAALGVAPAAPDGVAPCPAAGRTSPVYQARAPPGHLGPALAAHTG
jgi:hypothetical protein